MLQEEFRISSFLPPGLTTIGGKTYVVPGWHVVPEGTTLEEVNERWSKDMPKNIEETPEYKIYEMVDSSKGDKQYDVTFDGLWWSCTCPGFGFRRDCRHLKEVKQKHNIK